MKYTRRIVFITIVMVLLLSVCVFATEGVTKTETVNVALGKQVYAGASPNAHMLTNGVYREYLIPPTYPGEAVELPTGDILSGATSVANDWFIVDLGRRYNLTRVDLYPRGDGGYNAAWMRHFKLLASNDITFSDSTEVELGAIGADPEVGNVTSEATPFTVELDGANSYRYVKIQKTDYGTYGYGEIEVFAELNVMEVSRGKDTEVNYASYYTGEPGNWSPDKVVDGVFSNGSGWIMDGLPTRPEAPYNLLVDLGEDMPIGMIEMFARPGTDVATYRRNWKIYGYTEGDGKPDISGELVGGTLLVNKTDPFPQINDTVNPGAADGLQVAVDDTTPYRYLVFSKTVNELGCITEIRAYVVSAVSVGAHIQNAQTAVVNFGDAMDESTIADGLTVKIDGNVTAVGYDMTDEYTLEIDFGQEYFDSRIDIVLTDDIKSLAGSKLAPKEYVLYTPKALVMNTKWLSDKTESASPEITSLEEVLATGEAGVEVSIVNNASDSEADAIVLTVLFDENNYVVAADEKRITVNALDSGSIVAGIDIPEGVNAENISNYKLSAFIWRDYTLMKPWISKITLGE